MSRLLGVLTVAAAVVWAPPASAQPEMPKPGPEHEKLKKIEGEWDCICQFGPTETKGTFNAKMELGGFWLIGEFKGEAFGAPFTGKLLNSFDPVRKKYTSVWVDSVSGSPYTCEGEYDKDGKILTLVGQGYNMEGKPEKFKNTYEWKDKDTFEFKMYDVKDDKDNLHFTITYKRKK